MSADAKLKSLAERIERLMDERDGIQSDIRDIYTEAKSAGYVPKVLRKAITRKRMDPSKRDEEDSILDLYEHALSPQQRKAVAMAAEGATSREIEEATGIDHATAARSVALKNKSATRSEPGLPPDNKVPAEAPVAEAQIDHSSTEASGPPGVGSGTAEVTTAQPVADAKPREAALQKLADLGQEIDADDLTPPPFLDRRKQVSA